jgi:toxin ParE1/3/4
MIERSSEAMLDLAAHVLYLHREAGPEIALRFVDAVEEALRRLEEFPELGRLRHFRQAGLRSWMVPGFRRWLLFYLPVKNGVRLYRVIHSAMDLERQLGPEP